jgi:sporulation protein YlmC with PRC-barrel domain
MRRAAMLLAALALVAQAHAEGFYAHLFEPDSLRLDEVIGMEVVTADGRSLGRIHDVLYDRSTGAIESIALDGAGERYPVSALVSADATGQVLMEAPLDSSSAGGTALLAVPLRTLSSARGEALLIDLRAARVRPQQ